MKNFFKRKGAQLVTLQNLVISLIIVGFVIVIGLTLMGQLEAEQTADSAEANATGEVIAAMAQIPDWLGIIVLAVIGVVILGVIQLFRRAGGQ